MAPWVREAAPGGPRRRGRAPLVRGAVPAAAARSRLVRPRRRAGRGRHQRDPHQPRRHRAGGRRHRRYQGRPGGRGGAQVEEARQRPSRRQRRPGPACRVGAVRVPASRPRRRDQDLPAGPGGGERDPPVGGPGPRRVEPVGHRRRSPRAGAHRGARRHPDRGLGPLVADQPDRRRVAGAPRRDHRAGQLGPDPDRGRMAGVPGEARLPRGWFPPGTAAPTPSARRTPATRAASTC